MAALLALGTVLVAVSALGSGELAPPPPDPSGWGVWAERRDGPTVVFALLRLGVLGLVWYCLGATLLCLVVRLGRIVRFVPVAEAVTVPVLRRLVTHAVGVSLAVGVLTPPGAALALPPTPALAQPPDPGGPHPSEPPPLHLLRPRPSVESRGLPSAPAEDLPGEPAAGSEAAGRVHRGAEGASPRASTHVVQPGESLWSIARDALETARGTAADEDEVADYWSEVVEHNRDDLPDPENPDLIFPGQVVRLPGTSTSE